MNWFRIATFVVFCILMSCVMSFFAGGGTHTLFITSIAICLGYAFGAYQAMKEYGKRVNQMLESFADNTNDNK